MGKVLGVILAGGQATRMGGGDKPLQLLAGRTMLSHVIERLTPQCDALVLNANGEASRFAAYNLPVIADSIGGFQGPLAGILAGLDYAFEQNFTYIVSVAGDSPFLPFNLVSRLQTAGEVVSVSSLGYTHPVIGLWPVSLREALRSTLLNNERKIDRFTAKHGCVYVDFDAADFDPFFNVNTKEELEFAQKIYNDYINSSSSP